MSQVNNLVGQRFGRLLVAERAGSCKGRACWRCLCDCGNEKEVRCDDLHSGKVKSCGCLRKEYAARNAKNNVKHGMTGTRLWIIWSGMKHRCKFDKNYHGRGITVCDEWQDFINFYNWAMFNGYSDSLTIDRINPYGNYEPSNCRWATYKEQENNRTNNRILNICGCEKTLSEWADMVGISAATLSTRLNAGWPLEDLFIPPDLNNKNIRKERHKKYA